MGDETVMNNGLEQTDNYALKRRLGTENADEVRKMRGNVTGI